MKILLGAIVATAVLGLFGCAAYGGNDSYNLTGSGTQQARGAFPSQVIGP